MADEETLQCGAANREEQELMGLRIASIFVIMVGATFGALFPILSHRSRSFRMPKSIFEFAKYFGSGVIISTAFIHLLAPALEEFGNECLAKGWSEYPYALALCMLSIFFLFLVEIIAHRWGNTKLASLGMNYDAHGHGHEDAEAHAGHGSGDRETLPARNKNKENEQSLSSLASTTIIPVRTQIPVQTQSPNQTLGALDDPVAQIVGIAILEFGVVLHSVLVGLTLAVDKSFKILFVVLVFHQTFEGLGLGSRLAFLKLPPRYHWLPVLGAVSYGLTTPIGIAIGLGVRKTYNPESTTASIVSGTLDSVSAGILIYTGLVELLAHEFLFNKEMMSASNGKLMYSIGSMMLGWALMALLGKWA